MRMAAFRVLNIRVHVSPLVGSLTWNDTDTERLCCRAVQGRDGVVMLSCCLLPIQIGYLPGFVRFVRAKIMSALPGQFLKNC